MRRKLFLFAAVLSLVLCTATVGLWLRSYWYLDAVSLFPHPQHYWSLQSAEGRVQVQQTWASAPYWVGRRTEFWSGDLLHLFYAKGRFRWQVAGFGYNAFPIASGTDVRITGHEYQAPHAFLA